jgi:hypothetical protein
VTNEQLYFDALKRIAKSYQTPDQLRRNAEKQYGCSYHKALEMAYENLQAEAARKRPAPSRSRRKNHEPQ